MLPDPIMIIRGVPHNARRSERDHNNGEAMLSIVDTLPIVGSQFHVLPAFPTLPGVNTDCQFPYTCEGDGRGIRESSGYIDWQFENRLQRPSIGQP